MCESNSRERGEGVKLRACLCIFAATAVHSLSPFFCIERGEGGVRGSRHYMIQISETLH
jgi:hypothetical protein